MLNFKFCSEVLKTCPFPYLYGKVEKDENEMFTDFIIKDLNDKICELLNY